MDDPSPARASRVRPADGQHGPDVTLAHPNGYADVSRRALRPWVAALLGAVAPAADSFAVRFTSDREMRRLNGEYRGKDRTTDVLSFPGGETPDGNHLGDVVIAVPTARRQAAEHGH